MDRLFHVLAVIPLHPTWQRDLVLSPCYLSSSLSFDMGWPIKIRSARRIYDDSVYDDVVDGLTSPPRLSAILHVVESELIPESDP